MPRPSFWLPVGSTLCLLLAAVTAVMANAKDVNNSIEVAQTERRHQPTVVLLHGLARSHKAMKKMSAFLSEHGYRVCNIDYPSTEHSVEVLAKRYVWPEIERCVGEAGVAGSLDFVTHSMGGIILRQLMASQPRLKVGRAVMLSPPNKGSEIVDRLGSWKAFQWLNGPAGQQLGTDDKSLPNRLGKVDAEVGVIMGTRSINPILSLLIPGDDDGKVSVQRAKLAGMKAFITVPATHTFIMRNARVMENSLAFLQRGEFLEGGRQP